MAAAGSNLISRVDEIQKKTLLPYFLTYWCYGIMLLTTIVNLLVNVREVIIRGAGGCQLLIFAVVSVRCLPV